MALLRLDENQVRVVAPDVGGGFGAKFVMYPGGGGGRRRLPACCAGRSNGSRTGASISSPPCRSATSTGTSRSRSTSDGRLLGVRGRMIHDEGAYTPQGINLPYNASTALPGPYILPAYELDVQVVETNKVATMPVRGAGYPEGAFAMERVLDAHRRRRSSSTAPRCGGAISCRPRRCPTSRR